MPLAISTHTERNKKAVTSSPNNCLYNLSHDKIKTYTPLYDRPILKNKQHRPNSKHTPKEENTYTQK